MLNTPRVCPWCAGPLVCALVPAYVLQRLRVAVFTLLCERYTMGTMERMADTLTYGNVSKLCRECFWLAAVKTIGYCYWK